PRLPLDADPHSRVRRPEWPDCAELPAVSAVTDNHLGDRLAIDIGEVGDPFVAHRADPDPQPYAGGEMHFSPVRAGRNRVRRQIAAMQVDRHWSPSMPRARPLLAG